MKVPLQIKVRNIPPSESYESVVREKAEKLASIYEGIISCRVVIETPHRHKHQGYQYDVRIVLGVPDAEIVVKREPHEEIYVAIREAFNAASRQLKDYVRRRRGDIKSHEPSLTGRVSKLFPDQGYGFLETSDGRDIYFHRNSVLNNRFDHIKIGTELRFSEEEGIDGPQASSLSII